MAIRIAPMTQTMISLRQTAEREHEAADAASEAALTGWDLTTENDGLAIVQGNATLEDGTVVTGAWGVQANVPADVTAAVTWASAVYDCDLLNGTVNIPLVKGKLFATAEITP